MSEALERACPRNAPPVTRLDRGFRAAAPFTSWLQTPIERRSLLF